MTLLCRYGNTRKLCRLNKSVSQFVCLSISVKGGEDVMEKNKWINEHQHISLKSLLYVGSLYFLGLFNGNFFSSFFCAKMTRSSRYYVHLFIHSWCCKFHTFAVDFLLISHCLSFFCKYFLPLLLTQHVYERYFMLLKCWMQPSNFKIKHLLAKNRVSVNLTWSLKIFCEFIKNNTMSKLMEKFLFRISELWWWKYFKSIFD